MGKIVLEPSTALYPLPAVMVTCKNKSGDDNVITLAWVGTVCSDPPMVSISVRPGRFSSRMLKETGEFVINIPSRNMVEALDYCGTRSGRYENKFQSLNMDKEPASAVNVALIKDCPINIECRVRHILSLGSHDMFIADVVAVDVREDLVKSGKIDYEKAHLIAYLGKGYFDIGAELGVHGFTVRKK